MGTNASGKKITWKVLAIFLAVLMLITALPMSAFAATSAEKKSNIASITVNGGLDDYYYVEGDVFKFDDIDDDITVDIEFKEENSKGETGVTGVTPADFWKYGLSVTPADGTVLGLGDNGLAIRVCYGDEENETGKYADLGQIWVGVAEQWSAVLVDGRDKITNNDFYVIAVDSDGDGKADTALTDVETKDAVAFENDDVITYGKPLTGAAIELDGFTVKKVESSMVWAIGSAENEDQNARIKDATVDADGTFSIVEDSFLRMGSIDAYGKNILPVGISADRTDYEAKWDITDTSDAYITAANKLENKYNYNLLYNKEGNFFYVARDKKVNTTDAWGNFWIYKIVPAYVKDIEIKKDPAKMTYFEGEFLNAEGMVVTLKYSNGYTRDIPAEYFNGFGIDVLPAAALTVAKDNNQTVIAIMANGDDAPLMDQGNARLVVKAKTSNMAYQLADFVDGKLPDGDYAIVASGAAGTATSEGYVYALSNEAVDFTKKIKGLASNEAALANKMLNPEDLSSANVFKVTKTVNGYTIQDSNGKYLARTAVADNKKYNNLVLVDSIADAPLAATWQITGTYEEDVWGNDASSKKSGSFWLSGSEDNFVATSNDSIKGRTTGISFYAVSVKGFVKLNVTKQPDLAYTEGDKLDTDGLTVELIDEDGNKTVVTRDDFSAYGITTSPADGTVLAAADNGKTITVAYGDLKADTDALKVYGPDLNTYTLADSITDGKYIIVADDHALSTIPTSKKYPLYATIDAAAGLTFENTLSGKLVDIDGNKIVSKVTTDMIWTVKAVKDEDGNIVSYDITDVNGNYLERTPDLENGKIVTTLATSADKSENALYNAWQISAAQNAELFIKGEKYDADNAKKKLDKYSIYGEYDNLYLGQIAYTFFASVYGQPTEELVGFDFYKVNGVVTEFALKTAPKLAYVNGEKLDLSGAEFTLVTSDGTNATVAYADAAKYGITVSLANEKALSLSDNGTVITATCGGKTVTVGTLAVSAVEFDRLAGATRIETAIEIAKKGWDKADYVILASALNYADALAGAPLATAYDAPILLTKGDALEADVLAQIKALAAKQVIILGGEKAVSANVAAALTANGINSTRVAGADRTETSTKIAAALFTKTGATADEFFFVRSDDFADALSVSAVAGIKKSPIIYINKAGNIDDVVANYLKSIATSDLKSTIIVGGTSAIGETAETALKGYFKNVNRIGGADRYATSLLVVKTYDSIFTSKDVAVATGKNYPDALAGGAFAAKNNMPVLLVSDGNGTVGVRDYIKNKADFGKLYCFGGELALSNDTVATLLN